MSEFNTITCLEAQQRLQHIKTLEQKLNEFFDRLNEPNRTSKDREKYIAEAREVKSKLEKELAEFQEQINPFEKLFNLREQYKSQVRVLERAYILETKEINGEQVKGITDIEGDFQPIPSRQEIIERMFEKKELLEIKQTQGFREIRLIPFGMSLDDLLEKYKLVLIEHVQEGRLFTARKDRNDPNEEQVPLELDILDPVFIADEYINADKNGELVYGVTEFDKKNHGGLTKTQILQERKRSGLNNKKSGWDILVLEDTVNILREGQGKTIGGRAQIERYKSPEKYLELLRTPEYKGEVGLTPEEAVIHAITELVNYNEVIESYQDYGSCAYNIGAYFKEGPIWSDSGLVPNFYFYRDGKQATMLGAHPASNFDDYGIRTGVRV